MITVMLLRYSIWLTNLYDTKKFFLKNLFHWIMSPEHFILKWNSNFNWNHTKISLFIKVFKKCTIYFHKLLCKKRLWNKYNDWLTATCRSLRMAWLLPDPQYAMARVNIPDHRRMGSLSRQRLSIRASASSKRPYMVRAIPRARPRRIFSCCVSLAYWTKSL